MRWARVGTSGYFSAVIDAVAVAVFAQRVSPELYLGAVLQLVAVGVCAAWIGAKTLLSLC